MTEPLLFGFSDKIEKPTGGLKVIAGLVVGNICPTKEEAINAFHIGFEEMCKKHEGKFLYVRRAPRLVRLCNIESEVEEWSYTGRFTVLE